jgi:D-beta-D-heptose 7-phosphate kinase/D-beta-D-heptose 1-phosphate adenosyltransferase
VDFVDESSCLGGAGNVAANLVAGALVMPFGVVGADDAAETLRGCLRSLGLYERALLADSSRKTTVKTRIIARHQQVVRVDRETRRPLSSEVEERLIRRILAALPRLAALVVSDYDKGSITDAVAERVLAACQRLSVPAFVKPKWSRLPTYRGATAIVCNRAEAGFLVTRVLSDDESVEQAGRALLAHFGSPAVIVTRGEQGMSLFEQEAPKAFHIPASSRELPYAQLAQTGRKPPSGGRPAAAGRQVFDVTGAGDTVLATLALAYVAGASLREAVILANHAAGIVVGKVGTAAVSPAELLAELRGLE